MVSKSGKRIILPIAAALLVVACNKKGGAPSGSASESKAAGAEGAGTPGDRNSAAVQSEMSDPNIFYVLDAANMSDSAKGALASTRGTSSDVREFARMIVRDHHSMRTEGQALAKRLAIQPSAPAGDSLPAKLASAMSNLQAAAKGRDFDKAYIDYEVAAHREVLTIVAAAMGMTQNSEIKNLIQKAAPVILAHLDQAAAIQKNLQK